MEVDSVAERLALLESLAFLLGLAPELTKAAAWSGFGLVRGSNRI